MCCQLCWMNQCEVTAPFSSTLRQPCCCRKPGPASLSPGGSAWAVGCYRTVWLFSLRAEHSYNPDSAVHPAYFWWGICRYLCPRTRNVSPGGDSEQQPSGSGFRYNALAGLTTAWKRRLCWRRRRRFHIRSTEEKPPPPVCFGASGECFPLFITLLPL